MGAISTVVIPGRAQRVRAKRGPMTGSGANPESRNEPRACVWIPGSRAIDAFTRVVDALWRVPRNDN